MTVDADQVCAADQGLCRGKKDMATSSSFPIPPLSLWNLRANPIASARTFKNMRDLLPERKHYVTHSVT